MLTQKQFVEVDDLEKCSQILRSKDAKVTNMGELIAQISAHTGKSYPWLQRYTCMSPFSLNGPEHQITRKMLASYFTGHRIQAWEPVFHRMSENCFSNISELKNVDLVDDIVVPLTESCTYYALGLELRERTSIEPYLNHLLQLTNFNNPLKISDFAKLDFSAETLAKAILDARIPTSSGGPNEPNNTNDFFGYLTEKYQLSTEDKCAYMSAILAAGISTKHTLINVFVEILSIPQDKRKQLFSETEASEILDRALYTGGGVETIYRKRDDNVVYALNIAKAAESECGCPFSSHNSPANRHLAFGSGIHKCIGESLSRSIMTIILDHFFRKFPSASLAIRPASKSYTHSKTSKITVLLDNDHE